MVVHGGDIETVLDELGHHRIDLGLQQDEVAHHHRAVMHRPEGDPAAERESGTDADAIQRDPQVAARKTVAMHIAAYGGAAAKRFVDLLPVDRLGVSGGRTRHDRTGGKPGYKSHIVLLVRPYWPVGFAPKLMIIEPLPQGGTEVLLFYVND